ncbi:MAG: helix-turn-helix domain-containing protein [Betaproteobacteria bacterium]|nr:helix-turn-helix domain-containing protein [Betaproteobacteria bacterium]
MADIASLLKAEITRLARKEMRGMARALKQSGAQVRSEIAGLKARAAALEKQLVRLQRQQGRASPVPQAAQEEGSRLRFTAKGFKSLRERLELSGADMARLLGVSLQSVYKWESGSTRPRAAQLQAIAALRRLGKKEARARLDQE